MRPSLRMAVPQVCNTSLASRFHAVNQHASSDVSECKYIAPLSCLFEIRKNFDVIRKNKTLALSDFWSSQ
jgi:hypothetical protein